MSVIDDLSALQDLDGIIRELQQQANDIPARRIQELGKISAESDELAKAKEEVNRRIMGTRSDEVQISEIKETVNKFKTQQMTLKTNVEFAAMNTQIAKADESLKAAESKLIDDQINIEPAEKFLAECQSRYNEAKAEVDEYVRHLDERLAVIQKKLDDALVVRAEKVKPLDAPATRKFLMYYERLRKSRWPVLIKLTNNVCTGCHMELPPSKQQEARKNSMMAVEPAKMMIIACDFCGRIVY